jgi:hypothetical protein
MAWSPEYEIERGARIAQLLDNEYVQEALSDVEADIVLAWKSGSTVEEREVAHAELRGLEALLRKFRCFVDGGTRASTNMSKEA